VAEPSPDSAGLAPSFGFSASFGSWFCSCSEIPSHVFWEKHGETELRDSQVCEWKRLLLLVLKKNSAVHG
jgi:hypothetical protein